MKTYQGHLLYAGSRAICLALHGFVHDGKYPRDNPRIAKGHGGHGSIVSGTRLTACTVRRKPIAFRMANKLLRAGLPLGERVR